MFEYIAQLIQSVDIFGTGAIIPVFALIFGLSYMIGQLSDSSEIFAFVFIILSYSSAILGIKYLEEFKYLVVAVIFTIIWIMWPDGVSEIISNKRKNQ